MKILGVVCILLLAVSGLFAQRGGYGSQPGVAGGGTPATAPSLIRMSPNVLYPASGGSHYGVPVSPFANPVSRRYRRTGGALVYTYPVYVGGYGYDSYPYEAPYQGQDAGQGYQQQQQPNITVIYPPQPAAPVIPGVSGPPPPVRQPEENTGASTELTHYLIAFKDHTIYSAMAYWVDGDTLHYFTSGNTHNQVSLSLVDRDLSDRLNKEAGVDFQLPAAK